MADLILDGIGTFQGGNFDKVEIDGIVTINGDITANSFDNDGMATINGNITCNTMDCDGTCTIKGSISSASLEIDGMVTIYGDVNCQSSDIGGMITINGIMGAENVSTDGTLTVNSLHCNSYTGDGIATIRGDVKCQIFTTSGIFNVKGNKFEGNELHGDGIISAPNAEISADIVDFEGKINAKEIVGENITIHSAAAGIPFIKRKVYSSGADLIEATNIAIHGVSANEVNGCNIILGKHCNINRVDCTGTIRIHPSAFVGKLSGNHQVIPW